MSDKSIQRLVRAYDSAFLARMTLGPEAIGDPAQVCAAAPTLDEGSRDLLDLLLLTTDATGAVDQRLRPLVEAQGEALWRGGFILPHTAPGVGATIDPRHYAAACRVNPGLKRRTPLEERLPRPAEAPTPQSPPADARWDAVVVAAALEANPLGLNRDGNARKDVRRRVLGALGDDELRWELALSYARAVGLARPAVGRLYGFPESRARALVDPVAVLEPELAPAARALLSLIDDRWLCLEPTLTTLSQHARQVLCSPDPSGGYAEHPGTRFGLTGWSRVEAPRLRLAADALHRLGIVEATRDAAGVVELRRAGEPRRLTPGFMLTPDLAVLVGVGELPLDQYGRLCRLAPYTGGDRVHMHRITQEGVAADLAAGHTDTLEFLTERSRVGMPWSVKQTLQGWARSAERITLFTGVNVLEENGQLTVVKAESKEARVIDYGGQEPPPARFSMVNNQLWVSSGEDALTVRAALARVGEPLPRGETGGLRYRLAPKRTREPEALLETLRRLHVSPTLPGALETAVLAVNGLPPCRLEDALLIHLPPRVAEALCRDELAGPLLERAVTPEQRLVRRSDLPVLAKRLMELGLAVEAEPHG
ncbi:hypothetical protein L6R46_24165 [Myxococcota bacterium]|nr:hypothetical protein [Myxococcota bacterium]